MCWCPGDLVEATQGGLMESSQGGLLELSQGGFVEPPQDGLVEPSQGCSSEGPPAYWEVVAGGESRLELPPAYSQLDLDKMDRV